MLHIWKGDEWKMALITPTVHYESHFMPFDLCNSPTAFQHLNNDFCGTYWAVGHSPTWTTHIMDSWWEFPHLAETDSRSKIILLTRISPHLGLQITLHWANSQLDLFCDSCMKMRIGWNKRWMKKMCSSHMEHLQGSVVQGEGGI